MGKKKGRDEMPLSMVKIGERVRIIHVGGQDAVKKHLGALGFIPGAVVSVCNISNGNVIMGIHDSRLAIDEELVRKIQVAAV